MKKIIFAAAAISFLAIGCEKTPDYSSQLNSISQSLSTANSQRPAPDKTIDASLVGYQAVFLSNGQVYFGKYSTYSKEYSKLTDIYYLQNGGNLQSAPSQNSQISLVKLGNELHGPEDAMYIPQATILFVENLKSEGQVMQAIKAYKGAR